MYKLETKILEDFKKQFLASNKELAKLEQTPLIKKLIAENQKQINILEYGYYIK